MKKIVLIYDNTVQADSRVRTIIGRKSFGEIILKRRTMTTRIKEAIKDSGSKIFFQIVNKKDDFEKAKQYSENTTFFHLLSSAAIFSRQEVNIFLKKLEFVNETTVIRKNNITFGAVFASKTEYLKFIQEYGEQGNIDFVNGDKIELDLFVDISDYNNLLTYISGGFDARYFNSLEGDNFTVTKRSSDKKKMKMEYSYYWLLPERMKSFMVMPYDYQEGEDWASYTMERMPMTDIAIRWTHGAIDAEEFRRILDRTFYFFKSRETREVSLRDYNKIADELYLKKLEERTKKLKSLQQYKQLNALISSGTNYGDFDEIINEYKRLYGSITKRFLKQKHYYSVIGHGDVFFANMLYSKETNLLRLIDPKGALEEEDLWTDPYYDIAKLSHSICGNYDFFNTGSYDIILNKDMQYSLNIHTDNRPYVAIFKEYLEANNMSYELVRLYESSLFLSMLPLHIDNPHKVFGFILNAISILEEIKEYV